MQFYLFHPPALPCLAAVRAKRVFSEAGAQAAQQGFSVARRIASVIVSYFLGFAMDVLDSPLFPLSL